MCVCVCAHTWYTFSTLLFGNRMSHWPGIHNSVRLAGQWVPGIALPPSPQSWDLQVFISIPGFAFQETSILVSGTITHVPTLVHQHFAGWVRSQHPLYKSRVFSHLRSSFSLSSQLWELHSLFILCASNARPKILCQSLLSSCKQPGAGGLGLFWRSLWSKSASFCFPTRGHKWETQRVM